MYTDTTLNKHIKKYHEINEKIKELEALKKIESEFILNELDERSIETYETIKIVYTTKENIKNDIVKKYASDLWKEYHTTTTSRYLRRCKA